MKNINKFLVGIVAVVAILLITASSVNAASSTVTVTGNTSAGENQPGWLFNRDVSTSTPYEFNIAQASIGIGSLYVKPIGANPADKFIGENFINSPIANVNSISYDFRIGSGGVDTQEEHFYMNVYANFGVSPDNKFYDCRYNVVPTVGSKSAFTTVTFDPTLAYPATTRAGGDPSPFTCPAIPADMDTLSAGSNIRVFALNIGDTSANDLGLDGYLDKVVVNLDPDTTTSDFEPAALLIGPPTTFAECKGNNWMTFNNPTFNKKDKCEKYVKENMHTIKGNDVIYTAAGLKREADFDMSTAEDGSFEYDDAAKGWYNVKVSSVKVSGNQGWFAGKVVKASNPAWVNLWIFAKVEDNGPDKVWGSFTDEATAKAGVQAMSNPSDGPFNVTKKDIKIK